MKDDYLWDKSGSDPEIEKLEAALKVFRSNSTGAPEIPRQPASKPFSNHSIFISWFRQIAFAGVAAVVVGGIAFTFLKTSDQPGLAADNNVVAQTLLANRIPETNPTVPSSLPVTIPEHRATNPSARFETTSMNRPRRHWQRTPQSISTPKLTSEEQYAYNQLLLALSITGSKLKEVKDMANSVSESKSAVR